MCNQLRYCIGMVITALHAAHTILSMRKRYKNQWRVQRGAQGAPAPPEARSPIY